MKAKLILTWIVFLGLLAGCRMADIRTTEVLTPTVRNEAAAEHVRQALRPLRGVDHDKLVFDFDAGTVSVTYDSMQVARKNIELSIAYAGFDANDIPAEPAARAALPPECLPSSTDGSP